MSHERSDRVALRSPTFLPNQGGDKSAEVARRSDYYNPTRTAAPVCGRSELCWHALDLECTVARDYSKRLRLSLEMLHGQR